MWTRKALTKNYVELQHKSHTLNSTPHDGTHSGDLYSEQMWLLKEKDDYLLLLS